MTTPQEQAHTGFDPDAYRPHRADGVEVFDRGEAEDRRYVLVKAKSGNTLQITESDKQLWDSFDGDKTVTEIGRNYLDEHGTLILTRVYTLLELLWENGMLQEDPQFAQQPKTRPRSFLRFTHLGRIPIPGTRLLTRALGALFRLLRLDSYTAIGLILLLAGVGIFFFKWQHFSRYPLFHLQSSYHLYTPADGFVPVDDEADDMSAETSPMVTLSDDLETGILLLLALHLLCSFVRETVRGGVTSGFIQRAPPLRLVFNYGLPSFSVASFWRLAMPLRKRVVASCSGLAFELSAASVCLIALPRIESVFWHEIVTKLMIVLYVRSFFHFSPSTASDLHGVMQNWGDLPDFRRRAVGFLRLGLVEAVVSDRPMTREQRFFFTYNLVCVVWLVLAARFGLSLFDVNEALVKDLLMRYREYGIVSLLVLAAIAAPIFVSLFISLGWGAYLLYRWLSSQTFVRKPGNIILTVWAIIAFFVFFVLAMEKLNQFGPPMMLGVMFIANMIIVSMGIWFAVQSIMRERHGYTKIKLWLIFWILLFGALNSLTNRFHPDSMICILYLAMIIFIFIFYITYIVFKERHILAYWRTRYVLPELSMLGGIVVFQLSALLRIAGLIFGGDFPGFTIFTFISYSMIVSGLLAWCCGLRRVKLYCTGLAIDPNHGDKRGLISIGNYLIHRIGQIALDHFGRRAVKRLEKQMADKVPGRSFSFDEPYFPSKIEIEEIGILYREMLESLYQTLMIRYSQQFADAAFATAFGKVHWRGKKLLRKFVINNTQWQGQFDAELELNAEQRLDILRKISLFDDLIDKQLQELSDNMVLQHFREGDEIITQGDYGEACFLILSGEAQVQEQDVSGATQILAVLKQDDFFGEAALLKNVRRSASIIAISELTTLTLYKLDFEQLARRHPEVGRLVRRRLRSIHDLINVPIFSDLPTNLFRGILPRVRHASYKAGDYVIKEGDKGEAFYLIKTGSVTVLQEKDGEEHELRKLGVDEYFGEIALLQDVPRTASVRCDEDCDFVAIHASDFRQLMAGSQLFATNLRSMGEYRRRQ